MFKKVLQMTSKSLLRTQKYNVEERYNEEG